MKQTSREIACVEWQDLTPETFSLSLAEGKAMLQALQEVVAEWQMHAYLGFFARRLEKAHSIGFSGRPIEFISLSGMMCR